MHDHDEPEKILSNDESYVEDRILAPEPCGVCPTKVQDIFHLANYHP
jgi:hypothetical protein